MAETTAVTPVRAWSPLFRSVLTAPGLRLRAAALVVSALAAIFIGFLLPNPNEAAQAVRHYGWYVIAAAFALCAWALIRLVPWRAWWTGLAPNGRRRSVLGATALIVFVWVLGLAGEPTGFKVTNDEYVLQATALNMHLEREPAALVRAYYINGAFTPVTAYIDKRPLAFPFALSLLHDLTGYRITNAFLLNATLGALSLVLVLVVARRISGSWWMALSAVVLWGGLPLFVQNLNGSGMEMLNITLIGLVMVLAWNYLVAPDEAGVCALVFTTILLAQTRYESVLFIPVAAAVIIAGWRRAGRVLLPWAVIAAPLLLLPYAWQHVVVESNRAMWELQARQEVRFGVLYLTRNLRAAVQFYFGLGNPLLANSPLLAGLGVVALVAAAVRFVRRVRTLEAARLAFIGYALVILANLALVMFYYWGELTDPVACRFALPSLFLAALAVAWLLGRIRRIDGRWVLTVCILYTAGVSEAQIAKHAYTNVNLERAQLEWAAGTLGDHPRARLVISNDTILPWIIRLQPAILVNRAADLRDKILFHVRAGTFREIDVVQRLEPSSENGEFQIVPDNRLPADFHLQTLVERRFGATLTRISRLTAIGDQPVPATHP